MNDLLPALASLSPEHDEELVDGYQRYAACLNHSWRPRIYGLRRHDPAARRAAGVRRSDT